MPSPACTRGRGGEVWTLDRIRKEAVPADAGQQWHLNNNVIKYIRWIFEKPPGCPITLGAPFDMQEAWLEIIEAEQGVGDWYTIQAGGPHRQWSWRAFVLAMKPEEAEFVVGPGLVGILLYPRPESYDHHRAAAAKKHGHEDLSACDCRPPIWNFRFDRSDGSSVLVHPRWKTTKGMEISALEDCSQVPVMPKAGPGRSDGNGTHRRLTAEVPPAPPPPPSSPSPPSPRVLPKTQPQPPACAPPVGGKTNVTAAKAAVLPPRPCRLPPGHPATHDVRVAQAVRGFVIGGKAAVPASKAVAIAAKAAVPAAHPATHDVRAAQAVRGLVIGGKAAVPAPKAVAKAAKAALPAAKAAQPARGPAWTFWQGQWWGMEQGRRFVWKGEPWQ